MSSALSTKTAPFSSISAITASTRRCAVKVDFVTFVIRISKACVANNTGRIGLTGATIPRNVSSFEYVTTRTTRTKSGMGSRRKKRRSQTRRRMKMKRIVMMGCVRVMTFCAKGEATALMRAPMTRPLLRRRRAVACSRPWRLGLSQREP